MSSLSYITYPIEVDAAEILATAVAAVQVRFPDWEAKDPNLDFAILQSWATEAAQLRELASSVPDAIFRVFGSSLMDLPPTDASPATVATTWTMIDSAGYTIPTGTLVSIPTTGDSNEFFQTVSDVVILPGSTSTAVGGVIVVATIDGAAANGLGAASDPVNNESSLAYVDSIIQEATTAGGTDAEQDSDYFDRLKQQLQLMSPRLIIPSDYAAAARFLGAHRSLAIDGYNPGSGGTYNNPRTVSIANVDIDGNNLGSPLKTIIDNYCQAQREVNFNVFIIDPTINGIDVATTVTALPGFDHTMLQTDVVAAINDFLDKARWARDPTARDANAGITWVNKTVLRFQDVSAVVRGVLGVDHWTVLTICIHSGTPGTADINLTGAAPLADATTVAVTVS